MMTGESRSHAGLLSSHEHHRDSAGTNQQDGDPGDKHERRSTISSVIAFGFKVGIPGLAIHRLFSALDLELSGDEQAMEGKLIEHWAYIREHGQDLPEILGWKWEQ